MVSDLTQLLAGEMPFVAEGQEPTLGLWLPWGLVWLVMLTVEKQGAELLLEPHWC